MFEFFTALIMLILLVAFFRVVFSGGKGKNGRYGKGRVSPEGDDFASTGDSEKDAAIARFREHHGRVRGKMIEQMKDRIADDPEGAARTLQKFMKK